MHFGTKSSPIKNALKYFANIPDEVMLISPEIIEPIMHLKTEHLGSKNPHMHTDELLLALSICAVSDDYAERAMQAIGELKGSEVHSTVILAHADDKLFTKLRSNSCMTMEAYSQTLQEIQRLFWQDCPFVCLYYRNGSVLTRKMFTDARDVREPQILRGVETFQQ